MTSGDVVVGDQLEGRHRRRAAETAVDADRLIPGEDPETQLLEDAQHWLRVYEELTSFKHHLLSKTMWNMAALPPDASGEVMATDLQALEMATARLTSRRDFWKGRVDSLLLRAVAAPHGGG